MNGRSKAGTGGRVKRKVERPPDDKEQSARFVETARKLESDESGKEFERALKIIRPPSREKDRREPRHRPPRGK